MKKQYVVSPKSWTKITSSVCGLMLAACSGNIDTASILGDNGPGSTKANSNVNGSDVDGDGVIDVPGNGNKGVGTKVSSLCTTPEVSAAPMRRLTHVEYENTVRALLGKSFTSVPDFAADTQGEAFDTMADQHVSALLADEYLDAATGLVEGIKDVNGFIGCAPAASSEACVKGFIAKFGRRVYRRPLSADETTRLSALYDATKGASDAATGVRSVIAALLSSPNFLFRPEWGTDGAQVANAKLTTGFEVASRLSFTLWAAGPDDALLDAAANGKLDSRDGVVAQAQLMLQDARARQSSYHFYEQWFGISHLETATKDPAIYPQFNDGLRTSMFEETRRFVDHVVWEDDAKLATLLSAPYSFVNKSLATLYGVDGPADDATFKQVELDSEQRSGVLTQASLMTAHAATDTSSPVKRGTWVRTRMLCQDLPAPPPGVGALPEIKEGVSTRERFALHTSAPACASCHKLIDGLGFGLEHYDGIGAFREMDQGVAVDASGSIAGTKDIDGKYEGGPQLAAMLSSSEQVQDCAVKQYFRYTQGRREASEDACSLQAMRTAFVENEGDLQKLLLDLVKSDAFTHYRSPG